MLPLADLLASCPELTLLVTSRKTLPLRSEHLLMYRLSRPKSEEELQRVMTRCCAVHEIATNTSCNLLCAKC